MTIEVLGFYDLTLLTVLEFDFDLPVIHVSVVGLQRMFIFIKLLIICSMNQSVK